MELRIVNRQPKYAPPPLAEPPKSGYLHLAASVSPPVGPPFVRRDATRAALLGRCSRLAAELERHGAVRRVSVYRAVLIPPLGRETAHPARYDVAVLIETGSPEVVGEVAQAPAYRRMSDDIAGVARDVHVMAASCARSLGEVDRSRQGLFLFNHFSAEDAELATRVWEHLAGWYVAETGLDSSTLLAPLGESDYALVNHARWDKSVPRLAVEQFAAPSFHSYVRANLRAHGMVAMPVLYRLVES
jgi:hypothetical protein